MPGRVLRDTEGARSELDGFEFAFKNLDLDDGIIDFKFLAGGDVGSCGGVVFFEIVVGDGLGSFLKLVKADFAYEWFGDCAQFF